LFLLEGNPKLGDPPFCGDPFALGVASGEPVSDGLVLWTRLAPIPHELRGGMPATPVAVRWELAEEPQFRRVVRSGTVIARPRSAHSVHVELRGLEPASPYWFRFTVAGHTSPTGSTRTAPAPSSHVDAVRFAVAAWQPGDSRQAPIMRELARDDLDFVVFASRSFLESSADCGNSPSGSWEVGSRADVPASAAAPRSLENVRMRHAVAVSEPSFRFVRSTFACLVHASVTPRSVGGLGAPLETSAHALMQSFREHMPHRVQARRAVVWGDLLNLDLRDLHGRTGEAWQLVRECVAGFGVGGAGYVRCEVDAGTVFCDWRSAGGETSSGLEKSLASVPSEGVRGRTVAGSQGEPPPASTPS
jgi:phosphodiesterase/alkaline phosphatase D-like protein